MADENVLRELHDAIETLLHAHTPQRASSAELARLRAARHVRDELLEVAETIVDEAIENARKRTPVGHTQAEIGAELGMTSQAVGQRIRQRALAGQRRQPPAEARADRLRRQRAEQDARVRAGMQWPGSALRAVTDEHGRIAGYRPAEAGEDTPLVRVEHRPPRPRRHRARTTSSPVRSAPSTTSPQPPAAAPARARPPRTFASSREHAWVASGGSVFRPEMVRAEQH